MPARPWHRGSLGRRLGNGPFGTLDRNPKSQIVIIGEPRQIGLRSKRTSRHPKLPAHSAGRPSHPVLTFASPGWALWGRLPTLLCVSSEQLSVGHQPPDPAPSRLPVPLLVAFHLVSPVPLPKSSAGPPLGPLPVPSPEDSPRADTHCHPAAVHPISQHRVRLDSTPLTCCFWQNPCVGFVFNLQRSQSQ